jgi:hypothetical protein
LEFLSRNCQGEYVIATKPGSRLRSAVCDVEVIVIKAPPDAVDLRCGGHPLIAMDTSRPDGASAEPGHDSGTLLGKRYTNEDGSLELLCTKAGASSLSIGDVPLQLKEAKPLPSSD